MTPAIAHAGVLAKKQCANRGLRGATESGPGRLRPAFVTELGPTELGPSELGPTDLGPDRVRPDRVRPRPT